MDNMIKLIRTLAPENGMDFEEILSLETENYIGIWNCAEDRFILIARSDCEFNLITLTRCDTLDELDDAVYEACGEHITGVSSECRYRIMFE